MGLFVFVCNEWSLRINGNPLKGCLTDQMLYSSIDGVVNVNPSSNRAEGVYSNLHIIIEE